MRQASLGAREHTAPSRITARRCPDIYDFRSLRLCGESVGLSRQDAGHPEALVLRACILELFEQPLGRDVELLGCLVGAVGDGVAVPLHQLIPNVR